MATVNAFEISQSRRNRSQRDRSAKTRLPASPRVNLGNLERQISLVAGAAAAILGVARRDARGLLLAALGAGLIYRGASGHSHVYGALDVNARDRREAKEQRSRIRVVESFLVDKPLEEIYVFWRNLENLPTIMSHLQSVHVTDERHSHWVAKAPKIAGGRVEWEAEIIDDRPNARIVWRSLPGADVENDGAVEFQRAPGDRGTVVRVELEYGPPAGRFGSVLAKLFGDNPERQIREDLRNFKRGMEVGEILTTKGQPRGSCFAGIGRLMS